MMLQSTPIEAAHKTARRKPAPSAPQPIQVAQLADALLKRKTVGDITALSGSTIDRKVAAGQFPAPIRLGARCTRWRAADVTAWLRALGA